MGKIDEDWAIEFVEIEINDSEYERRICSVIQALLEIDEILKARESAGPIEVAA